MIVSIYKRETPESTLKFDRKEEINTLEEALKLDGDYREYGGLDKNGKKIFDELKKLGKL